MLSWQFGAPVFAGVVFLLVARVTWVRGQRRRSLAMRWLSVANVSLALCEGFVAVEQLANFLLSHLSFTLQMAAWSLMSDLWLALQTAALFLAMCAFVVAGVYAFREQLQRRSGMPR
jgi:hypothetical protein